MFEPLSLPDYRERTFIRAFAERALLFPLFPDVREQVLCAQRRAVLKRDWPMGGDEYSLPEYHFLWDTLEALAPEGRYFGWEPVSRDDRRIGFWPKD